MKSFRRLALPSTFLVTALAAAACGSSTSTSTPTATTPGGHYRFSRDYVAVAAEALHSIAAREPIVSGAAAPQLNEHAEPEEEPELRIPEPAAGRPARMRATEHRSARKTRAGSGSGKAASSASSSAVAGANGSHRKRDAP